MKITREQIILILKEESAKDDAWGARIGRSWGESMVPHSVSELAKVIYQIAWKDALEVYAPLGKSRTDFGDFKQSRAAKVLADFRQWTKEEVWNQRQADIKARNKAANSPPRPFTSLDDEGQGSNTD